jgi:preprotein translocase subunit SecA
MIEEREQILGQENYVRETYPEFYEKTRPYLDKIRTERNAEKLKYRLLQEFRKIVESYDGGWKYLRWFPERRELLFGKQVISSEETFVRVGKKIGRNDPCPCGSGKKYKFCCGRN